MDKRPVAWADRDGSVLGWQGTDDTPIPFLSAGITRIEGGISVRYTSSSGLEMGDVLSRRGEGVYALTRTWKNVGMNPIEGTAMLELITVYEPTFTMIPGVMYDGNAFGSGGEPKGFSRDGEPWVFAYDRSGLPSATFSEDGAVSLGLMAAADTAGSLNSSGSLAPYMGRVIHRLMWPAREGPLSYARRDGYAPAWRGILTLRPGASFTATAYIVAARVRQPNTGWFAAYDAALDLYDPQPAEIPDHGVLWSLAIAYGLHLAVREGDLTLVHIGYVPNQRDKGWHRRESGRYEIGWCGQNLIFAHAFLHQALEIRDEHDTETRRRDDALCEMGLAIADAWVATRRENGLIAVHYDPILDAGAFPPADVCNLGWAALKLLDLWALTARNGIERGAWRRAALGICDFLIDRFSAEHLFGRRFSADGALLDGSGSIGGFALPALVAAHHVTGEVRYLDAAKTGFTAYARRDLARMALSAGALDTDCVDKETVWPLLRAGIDLYKLTGEEQYLRGALAAGYYFLSWMYHYEPLYVPDSDFAREGFRVTGMTSVSTQHHHLDPWGALAAPELERLAEVTGDASWRRRADLLWRAAAQCVTDGRKPVRDRIRPMGSQNEAYFHTRWSFSESAEQRGAFNDWLVAWPSAFRLEAMLSKHRKHPINKKEVETP